MELQPSMEAERATGDAAGADPGANRRVELVLVIIFLALIASGIVIQTAVELWRGQGIGALDVFHRRPTSANLRSYEHSLEDASILARALRPWFQFMQFTWLRDGGEKALVGRNGWLFYKPGYDDMLARSGSTSGATNDPVAAIVAWRDALAARGIRLLVIPAPNKETIYPDYLTRRVAAKQSVPSEKTRNLLARLKTADIEYVDLFELFAEARGNSEGKLVAPLYLVQDSHWSPAGIELAAKAVAERLITLGWLKRGPLEYRERPAPVERLGDVLRMLQCPLLEQRAAAEKIPCQQVVRADTGEPYQDDPQASVLILGDSFLRIFEGDEPSSAGFIAHLAKELGRPVASLVNDGGASTLVRQELFRRPQLLAHTKVLIWEFVERDVHLGTEGWQIVPLPPKSGTSRVR